MGNKLDMTSCACDPAVSTADAWPRAHRLPSPGHEALEGLAGPSGWDGPLIVSMPRTGSTLLGLLFLFSVDSDGRPFDRYVHEPAAPVFWREEPIEQATSFITPPLSRRDVVQDSAYQFTHPAIARWFLSNARKPVVFTTRHPQLAWPSRWRAVLGQRLAADLDHRHAPAMRDALERDDYSQVGHVLTRDVDPPDNGVHAFNWMLQVCRDEGIEHVVIDNGTLRRDPTRVLEAMCDRLDIGYSDAMTSWSELGAILPRVLMSDLASGDEYDWYYAGTLGSTRGIEPERRPLLDLAKFPAELRGETRTHLTIDDAVASYLDLLDRPETLGATAQSWS